MRSHQPLGSLPLQHKPVAKKQVHEIVFDEAFVTDANPDFAFSRQDAHGGAAVCYFALVQIFIQKPSELVVNIKHYLHDPPIQSMEILPVTGLNRGTDFN